MFLLNGRPTERVHDAMLQEATRLESLAIDLRRIATGAAPQPSDLVSAPVLTRWRRTSRPVPCLVGIGNGHPRIPDGPFMTTDLWAMDPTAGWGRTLGRYYTLGVSADAYEAMGVGHD
jgi:hypothetical protein